MSDFAPSIAAAQAAMPNMPIVTRQHPTGAAGAQASMLECAMRIRTGRLDPRVRAWAIKALKAAGDPQPTVAIAQALLDALRKDAIYVNDPTSAEFIQAAHETLCLDDKGLCFRGGDCIPEDTLLLKSDMSLVPIKDIQVGDVIWGRDDWTKVEAKCSKGRLHIDDIELTTGRVLRLTSNHKVFITVPNSTESIRIRASDLHADDMLLQPKKAPEVIVRPVNEEIRVSKIHRMNSMSYCYDIQTSDHFIYLPEFDVTVSNCDDLLVAYGSGTSSVGIPTWVVGQSFDQSKVITHVLAGIEDRDGNRYRVDPSSKWPVGEYAMATHEEWIDPLSPLSPTDATAGGGEFVGVGQLPSASYQLVTNNQVVKGGHYRIGMIVSFLQGGLGLSTDPASDKAAVATAINADANWNIDSLAPTGDVTGGIQSWILEGTAKQDVTLVNTAAITYQAVAIQVANTNTPTQPSAPSVDVGSLILTGLAVGAIGGLIWGLMQRPSAIVASNPKDYWMLLEETHYRGVTVKSAYQGGQYIAWTAQGRFIRSGIYTTGHSREVAVSKAKHEIDKVLHHYGLSRHHG